MKKNNTKTLIAEASYIGLEFLRSVCKYGAYPGPSWQEKPLTGPKPVRATEVLLYRQRKAYYEAL